MFDDAEMHPLTPPEQDDPRPWEKGGVVQNGSWSDVLRKTGDTLLQLEQESDNDGNRAFLVRLAKDIKEEGMRLPEFPQAAKHVNHLMKRDNADAFKFGQLIATDPMLEQAVWYHANSVRYSRPANSLRGAIARLSQDQMWRLITRVSVESAVWHVPHMKSWVDNQTLHAVVVAEVASSLVNEVRSDEYVAGLLHGIGRLAIYRAALRSRRGPKPNAAYVDDFCRAMYPTIGALIGRIWDLEPQILEAIGHHNAPNSAPTHKKTAWMVHLANIIAYTAMAESEGLDTEGREVLSQMNGVRFDIDESFDVAHDALSEGGAYQAAMDAEAENKTA
jgi:HD-like signal output (HDOD) protein